MNLNQFLRINHHCSYSLKELNELAKKGQIFGYSVDRSNLNYLVKKGLAKSFKEGKTTVYQWVLNLEQLELDNTIYGFISSHSNSKGINALDVCSRLPALDFMDAIWSLDRLSADGKIKKARIGITNYFNYFV